MPVGNSSKASRAACFAIAERAANDPSVRVLDVAMLPDSDDPPRRVVSMNLGLLSRKADAAR